jgi:hypothetical protein
MFGDSAHYSGDQKQGQKAPAMHSLESFDPTLSVSKADPAAGFGEMCL